MTPINKSTYWLSNEVIFFVDNHKIKIIYNEYVVYIFGICPTHISLEYVLFI